MNLGPKLGATRAPGGANWPLLSHCPSPMTDPPFLLEFIYQNFHHDFFETGLALLAVGLPFGVTGKG